MKIAAILFAFKRPRYLRRAIRTHKKVEGLDYFAFIDYSEIQKKIYEIVDEADIYTTIFQRPENLGLNESIKRGIQHVFNLGYDAVIALEDDLLLSDDAIKWIKYHLENVRGDTIPGDYEYGAVSLQSATDKYPFRCWGWGMWKDNWESIDWTAEPEEKNRDSWDVIMSENFRRKNWISYGPVRSKVKHIGTCGVHYTTLGTIKEKILCYLKK